MSATTLADVRDECLQNEANYEDEVVSIKSLRMDLDNPGMLGVKRGSDAKTTAYPIARHVYKQFSGVVFGCPGAHIRKLVEQDDEEGRDIAARLFNYWVEDAGDKEVLLRYTKDEEHGRSVRAMLAASWNPIKYSRLIEALIMRYGENQRANAERFDETNLVLNFTTQKFDIKRAKVGDTVEWGVRLQDSDVGFGNLQCMPYSLRLVCTNGQTSSTNGAAVNISHSKKDSADESWVINTVTQGFEMIEAYASKLVDRMSRADKVMLEDVQPVMQRINARSIGGMTPVSKLEDKWVRDGWEQEGKGELALEPNVLRLSNSYTRAANSGELTEDSRFKLQAIGGYVLDLLDTAYSWN